MKEKISIILPEVLSADDTPLFHKVSHGNGYFIGQGVLHGELLYIDDIGKISWFRKDLTGKILLIDHATPEIDGVLSCVKGVITRVGWPLAHIAIRAREMKIPSVVWVGNKFLALKKKNNISIDFVKKNIYAT